MDLQPLGSVLDPRPYVRVRRTHYVTVMVEEDTDSGHLLYEEWADAKLARVRLVPLDDSGRSTVYTVDLTWRRQDEVRAGFVLAAGLLTGHTGILLPDEIEQVIRAGLDAQARTWTAAKFPTQPEFKADLARFGAKRWDSFWAQDLRSKW